MIEYRAHFHLGGYSLAIPFFAEDLDDDERYQLAQDLVRGIAGASYYYSEKIG